MTRGFSTLVVVVLCGLTVNAAVLQSKELFSGFTFLGSRSSFDSDKREFIESNYYASAASGIWTQAQDDCVKTFGSEGHLVSIEEKSESDALNVWLQERGSGGAVFWTSGIYQIDNQTWRWAGNVDYNVTNFENWEGGAAPISPNGRQRIGLNHQNQFSAFWISVDDTNLERYICEMRSADNVGGTPPSTPPTTPTTPSTTTTPTTTTTPPPTTLSPFLPVVCNEDNDIVIAIGGSKSVGGNNFVEMKGIAEAIAVAFAQHKPSRISVFNVAESANVVIPLNNTMSLSEIVAAIQNEPFKEGPHNADLALEHGREVLTTLNRGLPRTILMVTDGLSNNPDFTKEQAEAANALGIRTFAFGVNVAVGGADFEAELQVIGGNDPSHVFRAEWANLASILRDLTIALCP